MSTINRTIEYLSNLGEIIFSFRGYEGVTELNELIRELKISSQAEQEPEQEKE